jgi:hypothetical protein
MGERAIACELPAKLGLPLSRLQVPDIRAEVIRRGLIKMMSSFHRERGRNEPPVPLRC